MSKLIGLGLLLFVVGAAGGCTQVGPSGRAVITDIRCHDDCWTTIAFLDDRSLWRRLGSWGSIGDTITAQRTWGDYGQRWRSPETDSVQP